MKGQLPASRFQLPAIRRIRSAARCLLAIHVLFTTACLGNSPTAPVDRQVVLAPGQTTEVAAGLSLRFIGVTGDSRCPADAFCVQGGDAIVRISILSNGATAERDLHTGNMQPVSYEAVRVELIQLEPYPFSSRTIRPDEYRATLRVTR
jgi:hypothetical protein